MTARRLSACVAVCTVALLVAGVAVAAPPGAWPNNKAELCWLAGPSGSELDEYSMVIAQITNMGNDHYLFHGQAYRVMSDTDWTALGDLQPFNGNAELDGTIVVGQLTKVEINAFHSPIMLETYTGRFWFDLGTLEGDAEGIISMCESGGDDACETQINTGPIPLTPIPCP